MRYDFKCEHCGYIFEINATPTTISYMTPACPNCHSTTTKKIILATNFIFKTDGFYSKDTQEKKE